MIFPLIISVSEYILPYNCRKQLDMFVPQPILMRGRSTEVKRKSVS